MARWRKGSVGCFVRVMTTRFALIREVSVGLPWGRTDCDKDLLQCTIVPILRLSVDIGGQWLRYGEPKPERNMTMTTTKSTKAVKPAETAEQFADEVKAKMAEGADKFAQGVADYADLTRETAAAVARTAGVAGKAAEKVHAEALALAAQTVRDGVATAREAADAKNAVELIELQAGYLTKTYSDAIARTAEMGDVVRGATENAVECLTDRMVAWANFAKAYKA